MLDWKIVGKKICWKKVGKTQCWESLEEILYFDFVKMNQMNDSL